MCSPPEIGSSPALRYRRQFLAYYLVEALARTLLVQDAKRVNAAEKTKGTCQSGGESVVHLLHQLRTRTVKI